MHTHAHRLDALESERLPHRIGAVEINVAQICGEVSEIKDITRGMGKDMSDGISRLEEQQAKASSYYKGVLAVFAALYAAVQLLPSILHLVTK
ncbi:hypothetical protein D3C81_1891680 [compost metagenome]